MSGMLHHLQFQSELLQVARADAVRNRTETGAESDAAVLGFAPGANRHLQRKLTLEGRNHQHWSLYQRRSVLCPQTFVLGVATP